MRPSREKFAVESKEPTSERLGLLVESPGPTEDTPTHGGGMRLAGVLHKHVHASQGRVPESRQRRSHRTLWQSHTEASSGLSPRSPEMKAIPAIPQPFPPFASRCG